VSCRPVTADSSAPWRSTGPRAGPAVFGAVLDVGDDTPSAFGRRRACSHGLAVADEPRGTWAGGTKKREGRRRRRTDCGVAREASRRTGSRDPPLKNSDDDRATAHVDNCAGPPAPASGSWCVRAAPGRSAQRDLRERLRSDSPASSGARPARQLLGLGPVRRSGPERHERRAVGPTG